MFGVVGQKDPLSGGILGCVPAASKTFPDFSFYLAPDAVHGVGLGDGTANYVDAYTQIAQWPEMAKGRPLRGSWHSRQAVTEGVRPGRNPYRHFALRNATSPEGGGFGKDGKFTAYRLSSSAVVL